MNGGGEPQTPTIAFHRSEDTRPAVVGFAAALIAMITLAIFFRVAAFDVGGIWIAALAAITAVYSLEAALLRLATVRLNRGTLLNIDALIISSLFPAKIGPKSMIWRSADVRLDDRIFDS